MPLYTFTKVSNPETQEDFFFTMAEAPKVDDIIEDDNGVKWKRIFTLPNAAVDSKIDHNNPNDFVEKTGKKKGSVGDLLDASKELSDRRAKERGGVDPVQQSFFNNYKKSRHGVQHFEETRKKKFENDHISIDFGAKRKGSKKK